MRAKRLLANDTHVLSSVSCAQLHRNAGPAPPRPGTCFYVRVGARRVQRRPSSAPPMAPSQPVLVAARVHWQCIARDSTPHDGLMICGAEFSRPRAVGGGYCSAA